MTDNVKATALIRQTAVLLAETAEAHRRERSSMNTSPLGDNIIDYATAAQMIATAMSHLDESLPNGQKVRTEQAVLLATIGLSALKQWLSLKGYAVTDGPALGPLVDDRNGVVRNCFRFIMTDGEGKTAVAGAHSTQDPHETHRVMSTALELTEASRRSLVEISDELFSKRVRGFNVPTPRLIAELKTMITPAVPALLKKAPPAHDLYTDADPDRPKAICDSNGEVVLGMRKKCGKGEVELEEPCEPRSDDLDPRVPSAKESLDALRRGEPVRPPPFDSLEEAQMAAQGAAEPTPYTSAEFIKGSDGLRVSLVECDPAWQLKADKLVPWRGAPPPSDSVSVTFVPDDTARDGT